MFALVEPFAKAGAQLLLSCCASICGSVIDREHRKLYHRKYVT